MRSKYRRENSAQVIVWDVSIGLRIKGIATAGSTAVGMTPITILVNVVDAYPNEPNFFNEKQARHVLVFR